MLSLGPLRIDRPLVRAPLAGIPTTLPPDAAQDGAWAGDQEFIS